MMAVFLSGILILSNFLISGVSSGQEIGVLGGPVSAADPEATDSVSRLPGALLAATPLNENLPASPGTGHEADNTALVGRGRGDGAASGPVLTIYVVEKGDTLAKISAGLGISVQTIIGANPELRARSIKRGQELRILPVSGVLYTVEEGETPESIASDFHLSLSQLKEFNKTVDFNHLQSGTILIIPGANPVAYNSYDNS